MPVTEGVAPVASRRRGPVLSAGELTVSGEGWPLSEEARTQSLPGLATWMLVASRALAGLTVSIGLLVLVGYAWRQERLVRLLPGLPPMYPNTAVALLTGGVALALAQGQPTPWRRRGTRVFAAVPVIVGAVTSALHLLRLGPTGIDHALWPEGFIRPTTPVAGRPVLETSMALLMLGSALLGLSGGRRSPRIVQPLALAGASIGLAALVGYAYGVNRTQLGSALFSAIGMALHTAIGILALALGILCCRPREGVMGLFTSASAGGILSRRLVGVIVIAPLLLSGVAAVLSRTGVAQTQLALSLVAVAQVTLLGVLLLVPVRTIEHFDRQRASALALAVQAEEALVEREPLIAALRAEFQPRHDDLPGRLEAAAHNQPAVGQLSGDWAEVLRVSEDEVALAVVDVAGHGAVAAVFALRIKHLLTTSLRLGTMPAEALAELRAAIDGEEDIATAVVARIDGRTGACSYANAGHPPLLQVCRDDVVPLPPTGPLLGAGEDAWATANFELRAGELLVAYTDGLIEARDDRGEPFREDRLAELLARRGPEGASAVAEAVVDAVVKHTGHRLHDDATVVVVARL